MRSKPSGIREKGRKRGGGQCFGEREGRGEGSILQMPGGEEGTSFGTHYLKEKRNRQKGTGRRESADLIVTK